jgi:hypothetical protein
MEILGKIKINNQNKGYLIHGQPFKLQFDFSNIKWGIAFYRPATMLGNVHKTRVHKPGSRILGSNIPALSYFQFIRGKDEINLISNAYYPKVKLVLFSSLISLKPTNVIIPLKINFLNTREIGSTHSIGIDLQSANIATLHPNIKKVESSITLNKVNISLRSLNSKNIDLYITTPSLNPIYHQ